MIYLCKKKSSRLEMRAALWWWSNKWLLDVDSFKEALKKNFVIVYT